MTNRKWSTDSVEKVPTKDEFVQALEDSTDLNKIL